MVMDIALKCVGCPSMTLKPEQKACVNCVCVNLVVVGEQPFCKRARRTYVYPHVRT